MRTSFFVPLFAILLATGCHPPLETKDHHIVHKGEQARLAGSGGPTLWLSVSKGQTHDIVTAVNHKDVSALEDMVRTGKAFSVESGTAVRITDESFNERHVEVTEGPQKGRQGWAPFEWLEPRL